MVALAASAPAAEAAAPPVATTKFQLDRQPPLRGGIARVKRSVSLDAHDDAIESPAPGSSVDPSIHGALLFLLNDDGADESTTVALPASAWSRSGDSWRYREVRRSGRGKAVIKATLAASRLSLRIRDKTGDVVRYTLDEAAQGSMAAVLELGGGGLRYCTAMPAAQDEGAIDAGCNSKGRFRAAASPAPMACAVTAAAPQARDVCDGWQLLDLLIEGQRQATGIPGVGAAIVRAGEPLWSKGYGQRSVTPSRPVLASTPFMLASISKTIAATAVLQLVEDGALTLDQDIDTILDFSVDNPRVPGDEVITVRHLLTHTSGLADDENVWGGFPGEAGSLYTLGDSPIALRDFMVGYFTPGGAWYDPVRNFTKDAPGSGYLYSNLATALLGYLVEAATGTPLDDHSDARIFAPLGMSDSGWHLADFSPSDVAMPYESFGGEFFEWGQYGYPDYPNGQMRASATDLARYLAAWASGGTLDAATILDPATVAEALSVQVPAVDTTQGLSWYHDHYGGRDVVGHSGGDFGATTEMYLDPATGNGIVLLTNTDDTRARVKAMERIAEAMFALAEAP
jgi:CubicO group peptidase (beta-lactamase class C family)